MKYYIIHNGQRHEFETLPKGTYFAVGYHGEEEKGRAFIMVYEPLSGTCLTPIRLTDTEEQFKNVSLSGQTLEDGKSLDLIF